MATIILKHSRIAGRIPPPDALMIGEVAINTADGVLYYKTPSDVVQQITSGSHQSFKTINDETITGDGNITTATIQDLSGKADLVHTHTADQVALTEGATNLFTGTTVNQALVELFTSANSIKTRIINAIGNPLVVGDDTDSIVGVLNDLRTALHNNLSVKDVQSFNTDSLRQLVDKILNVVNVDITGTKQDTGVIPLEANGTYVIQLPGTIDELDICTSILLFTDGQQDVVYVNFDLSNAGRGGFSNNENVVFDGTAHPDATMRISMVPVQDWSNGGNLLEATIPLTLSELISVRIS